MTTLSGPPIDRSQIWDPRSTAREEPQEAATVLAHLALTAWEVVTPPGWLVALQERIDSVLSRLPQSTHPYAIASAIEGLLLEIAPPGTAIRIQFASGEIVQIERPDPELAPTVRYLRWLSAPRRGEHRTPPAVAERCAEILRALRASVPGLPIPTIGPGPDGMVGMTWETDQDHLNLEVFPDGHVEVFQEDLEGGALWSDDQASAPPPEFLSRLRSAFSAS